ncbi:MAG: sugar ABC transporter substrate-binding protein [Rhodothermales bacterium]
MRTPTWTAALLCLLVGGILASCTGRADGERETLRVIFVTHGQASDPFWSVVQNGARQAGTDAGVRVEYQAPESFDMVAMSQLIDAAVASSPDGLVISMPDADALRGAVAKAVAAGIPIVSINSGYEVAQELGAMVHVGQTEYEAGYGGGERLAAAGVTSAFCINHEVGNTALDLRCQGVADAMREAGATSSVLAVEVGDPTESQQRIQAGLSSNPDVDGIITLGPSSTMPALRALSARDVLGELTFATFDVSPEILEAIEAGEIVFAIDQQPYLQGYLPVNLLALRLRNENEVANDVVRTGPVFITSENVARIRELTERGTR